MLNNTLPQKLEKQTALYCRRGKTRTRLVPSGVLCWSATSQPKGATVVEADSCGARLVVSFTTKVGEFVRVSFADELGFHQTRRARVAWVHRLESANRLMIGLAFDEEMLAA